MIWNLPSHTYTVRLLSSASQEQEDCFPSTALAPFPSTLPHSWYLSHTGPGSDSPRNMNHLTVGTIIIAFWDEHLLELLPGLLLGILPLGHTPGHICGKTGAGCCKRQVHVVDDAAHPPPPSTAGASLCATRTGKSMFTSHTM